MAGTHFGILSKKLTTYSIGMRMGREEYVPRGMLPRLECGIRRGMAQAEAGIIRLLLASFVRMENVSFGTSL